MAPARFLSPILHLHSYFSLSLTRIGVSLELGALFTTFLLSLDSLSQGSLLGNKRCFILLLHSLPSYLAFSEDYNEPFSVPLLPPGENSSLTKFDPGG